MSTTGIQAIDSSVQKMNIWLNDIMTELHWDNRERAYSALRAVLLALRDRLTIDESADLSAQLPLVIRGIYYDGWRPSTVPLRMRTKEEFFGRVHEFFKNDPEYDIERVTRAVFAVIKKYVTAGEISDVKDTIPERLAELWE